MQINKHDKKTVIIVDDSDEIRARIRCVVNSLSHLDLVAESDNGKDAVNLIDQHEPNFLILDIRMPIMSGIQVLETIQDKTPTIDVIILTNQSEQAYKNKCISLGAKHFLDKTREFVMLKHILNDPVLM